ncbi:MAG: ABC transporter ATP-binding protein [Cuniculiplasma sp.]
MKQTYEEVEETYIKTLKGRTALKRLIKDMAKNRKQTAILIASVMITAIAATFSPLAIGGAVNGVASRSFSTIFDFSLLFISLALIQFGSNRFRVISSTILAQGTVKNLRDRSFQSIQHVPISFFSKVKAGFLISRMTNDGETLGEFLTFQIPSVVSGMTTVILSIAIMLYLDFDLTLYALIVLPFLSIFTISLQGKVRKNYLRTRRTIAAITGNLAENISSIRSIKAFNVESYTEDKFDGLNADNLNANIKASRLSSLYGAIVRIIEYTGIAIVVLAGAFELKAGLISIGILVAFIFYVQEFFDPVIQLSQLYNSYQSSIVGVGRIYGIIDSKKEVVSDGQITISSLKDSIVLKNVSFSYDDSEALTDINLTIRKGENIGIVGHTGAGKTTLSNLIMKFYVPQKGEILVDGKNIMDINTESYRNLISPVLQEPFLFRGSIYENVKIADPEMTEEEIERLAKEFNLNRIFDKLPEGMETNVGELGRNLSEGQKQAIAILRALCRDPQIIIMDEPTSNIDPYSEKFIFQSLEKFAREKTLILITHRFSMISLVDKIVVIQDGSIVESGTFPELREKKGIFSQMYDILYGSKGEGID